MGQYQPEYVQYAPQDTPPQPKRWPLAGVMAIDFVVIIIGWLLTNVVILVGFIGFRLVQQGSGLGALQGLEQQQIMELLGSEGIFATLLAQNLVFVLVPVLRMSLLRREPLSLLGFTARPLFKLVALGIGMGVVVLIGNALIGALFQSFGVRQNQSEQYLLRPNDTIGQALFFLGAAVLAPIGEEVLFRGYVFNAIRLTFQRRPWGVALAYAASALLFSLAHSLAATEGIIALLVPTFLMGLILAWGMHRTGSLIPGIIAHGMNNSVALLVLLYCVNNPDAAACSAL